MKRVKVKTLLLTVLCVLIVSAVSVVGYAYFSNQEIYEGMFGAQVELLFDRLNDRGLSTYQTSVLGTTADPEAEWGTQKNPYVISDVKHLYNLAELQRLGYFYNNYISDNYDEAGTYNGGSSMPYFLVCTPDGTPVTIDGNTFGKNITSIGTEDYPFIGSVKGAFVEGTCTIEGKISDVSAIYDITVEGNPANVDSGLFGYIGYLGEAGAEGTSFQGVISEVTNLLLYDVTVDVRSSLWDAVQSFIEEHIFSFTALSETDQALVAHENHHIGILAGHISYAKVEFISIYYSDNQAVAINLEDTTEIGGVKANYMSVSGVVGFMDNMNPTVNADGTVAAGSGKSNEDISYGAIGGGGLLSGAKAGYVLACDMYGTYHYTGTPPTEDTTGTVLLKDALDKDGNPLCTEWVRKRILWGTEATGRYYFYDGVFTFALSSSADLMEDTWQNDEDRIFSIGNGDWNTNYSKGNNAVAAYVKAVTSDAELNAAIRAGKKLFIMNLNANDTDIFLMRLYEQSQAGSGGVEQKYTTPGIAQKFGNEAFIDSLIQSYQGGEIELSGDLSADYNTIEKLTAALRSGELRAINVGTTSSSVSLETLKQQYNITATATGGFAYFDHEGASITLTGTTVNDYYTYSGYDGYFYYTTRRVWGSNRYSYYWQPNVGDAVLLDEDSRTAPQNYFTVITDTTWQGEQVYGRDTYQGVVVNDSDATFYDSGHTANKNGSVLTKPIADANLNYFLFTVGQTGYTYSADHASVQTITLTGTQTTGGRPLYTDGNGRIGILIEKYPTYSFSNGTNTLRMMKLAFDLYGNYYTVWNGPQAEAENASNFSHRFLLFNQTPTVSNSVNATIKFNADGTCYIGYSVDGVTRYVNYTGSAFNGASSNENASTKLCVFSVEGTQDLNFGRITFDPASGTGMDFAIDEYVLFANSEKGANANKYSVVSLADLQWNNGDANDNQGILHGGNLTKKFRMYQGITFGASFNILNGSLGTDGFLQAPVGSTGVEANIPQSCIAFRVNKADGDKKIRVIVAVPVSEYYPGEAEFDIGTYTRYFNVWKMEEAGESMLQVFNAEDAYDRFILPASHPYQPGTSADDNPYINVNVGTVDDNGAVVAGNEDYRCYMNGDRILVAYEFTVSEAQGEGIYVLGTSGYDTALGEYVEDVPMEIVYFSAEGVASTGRDGAGGSQMGTIDFVYDYNQKIVTVTESSSTDENGNEDYNTYYPSYTILYFDNTAQEGGAFANINDELICIRRWIDDGASTDIKSTITATVSSQTQSATDQKYAKIAAYARLADIVEIAYQMKSP